MWMVWVLVQGAAVTEPVTVQTDVACAAAIAIELKQAPLSHRPAPTMMLAYLTGRLERDAPGRNIVADIAEAQSAQRRQPLPPADRERCFEDAGRVIDLLVAMVPPGRR